MNYRSFGADKPQTILLLHGGGLSWWNYRDEARLLEDDFRVILPILDGHAGSDRPFHSIEDCADGIIGWIDEYLGGSVTFLGGLSLGGQVLLEMLTRRPEICRYALIESAAVLPSRLTNALIGPAFGSSYGLIQSRRFARLQFDSMHIRPALFEDYYRDTCAIQKADMISFMKANTSYALKKEIGMCAASVHVFAGGRENRLIRRSAQAIKQSLPASSLTILPGYRHADFSLNHPEKYAATVRAIIEEK